MKSLHFLFLCILLTFCNRMLLAQRNSACYGTLYIASKEFELGHFDLAINLIKPCLKKGLKKFERYEANRLLAICYLNTGDLENAILQVKQLLKNKPGYKLYPFEDPAELSKLLLLYEAKPSWELGFKAGTNLNRMRVIKSYSLVNTTYLYPITAGYQFGFFTQYHINKNISAMLELGFEGINFKRNSDNVSGWAQSYVERLRYYDFSIYARLEILQFRKWTFDFEPGFQIQPLNYAFAEVTMEDRKTKEYNISTIDLKSSRSEVAYAPFAGVNIKHKLSVGSMSFNARYAFGLNNITKTSTRYRHTEFMLENQYIDNDMALMPIYLSWSFQWPFYNKIVRL